MSIANTGSSVPESFFSDDGSPDQAVGLANPHLSQERRRMLDLVNRLHSTGVQVDIDLPQIAVIGSQSAGKSSLIESISGITLPRAAGTCTRCPTECRLSRSNEPWKCVVFLLRMQNGQMHSEQFGSPIMESEKSKVEDRIRRAQRAILNPSGQSNYYLTVDHINDTSDAELSFSRDCVSLQISGPDVADLSFCDLPGLIASVGKGGNKNDIQLVESLATSYIRKPSCIILLTVACETDFQNQGAQELAKGYDPEGKRTIGVLTKPDRIPSGEEPNWLPFIRNEKEPLQNNWYCVKQPSSNELKQGMTWRDARKNEDHFFSVTSPWCDLDAVYKKYLGTSSLVDRLSNILSDLIFKRVPEIQDELERSMIAAREALMSLPREPSRDPRSEISTMLHVFVTDIARHAEGVPDEDGLLQSIRPVQERFRRALRTTAPKFRPFERRYADVKELEKAEFLAHEEGAEDFELDDDDDREILRKPSSTKSSRNIPRGPIYIDEVMERAEQACTRELPGNFPFVVQQMFINSFLKQWNAPAQILCKTVYSILTEHIRRLIFEHFAAYGQGALEQRIKIILQGHIKRCMERAEERINWLIELESTPFSLNTHYLVDYKDKFLAYYRGSREKDRNVDLMKAIGAYSAPTPGSNRNSQPPTMSGISKVLSGLAEIGIVGVKAEELAKLIPPDGMEPALVIMADVRAYFQVAYKRFADNIPLAIDHELVRGIGRTILHTLYIGLGINGPEGHRICQELAQESPNISGKREELIKKLERMSVANEQLLQIGM
ncbi:P-loop containing nucleoside triphosphate hydrolase protein [Collybia nuda]|uniref:P-loop containing nucleoside triphosphate hydrolase protein n=1 Tax=Collybia nuda TaxID=64659 RepID=A0A9P6CIF6_9AGAR|nr:P-loop containing nucleoside triphosphate hydrolase protein [Collybia nuda]